MSGILLNPTRFSEQALVLNPTHLLNMTDDTGLFQHCRYNIPDRNHGYTLDDNARALIVAARSKHPVLMSRLPVYLGFVMYCQRPDGLFRNFMGYDRHFLEASGSDDSQGRTLWALGVLYLEQPEYRRLAGELITTLLPHLNELNYLRSKAFVILGLHSYVQASPDNYAIRARLEKLADELVQSWKVATKNQNWQWFEGFLTYENARLPQALFAAYITTGRSIYLSIAQEAAAFLEKIHFERGYLKLIGNYGWLSQGQKAAEFDEQPVDAGALVEMYQMAYLATGDIAYSRWAQTAFDWYGGKNCHGLAVYEPRNGSCYDSLTAEGLNLNQGAESVLSYQLALQSLSFTHFLV